MEKPRASSHPYLFTVRMWAEEIEAGQFEWRGKVQFLATGETRYFRAWAGLVPLLQTLLAEVERYLETPRD